MAQSFGCANCSKAAGNPFKPNHGSVRKKPNCDDGGGDSLQMPPDNAGFSAAIINIQQQTATLTKGLQVRMDDAANKTNERCRSRSVIPRREHHPDTPRGGGQYTPSDRQRRHRSRAPERTHPPLVQMITELSDDSGGELARRPLHRDFETYGKSHR